MLSTFVIIISHWRGVRRAVAQVATLAANSSAKVILMGVMSDQEDNSFVDPVLWNVNKSETQAKLHQYVEYLRANNIKTDVKIVDVLSTENLFHYLDDVNCDLIVVPNNKAKESWLIESLLKHAQVPVFMARGDAAKSNFKNILVPLDGSPRAESSLNLAVSLARASGARLHLGHVVQQLEMPRRTQISVKDSTMADYLIQRHSNEAKHYLDQVAASLGLDVEKHVHISKKTSSSLHNLILQHNIDLLVMSAHGYSGDAQWPLGTVAENLIRYGKIPTVVVQDLPVHITRSEFEVVRTLNKIATH